MDYEHKLGKRYSFAVRDPRTGKSVYYCHLEEALCAVFEAREKSPLPAPAPRLFPLGEGVKRIGAHRWEVMYRCEWHEDCDTLHDALVSWCRLENEEFEGRVALNASFHGQRVLGDPMPDTTGLFDADGYKLKPLPPAKVVER